MSATDFRPVALAHASRLVNFGPTVLVTSAHGDRRNVMAAGGFGICVPGAALADATFAAGIVSGRDEPDKFTRHNLRACPGPVLGMPVIEDDCSAWMECRLIREPRFEELYDTCVGEVVAAAADRRVFSEGRWTVSDEHASLQTLHHLGAGRFAVAGRTIKAALA